MNNNKKGWIVVTTINPPTTAIKYISELCRNGWSAVVVGDTKTPDDWRMENIIYLSVERQQEIFKKYASIIPYRHYCRKNLGYLFAISQGAEFILETDDDNIPYLSFGQDISRLVTGRCVDAQGGWVNVYKYFTDSHIWPRGLPLDEIYSTGEIKNEIERSHSPVQQFLADNDPDVDAIYRLIFKNNITFNASATPVILSENTWTPFNSQNTLFFYEAFPLLYLPCHVSFRMTDIWRSFIVQEVLWIHGHKLAFHTSTVKQVRNEHDLMKDFRQEIIGYTDNSFITKLLETTRVNLNDADKATMAITARALWLSLVEAGVIPKKEIPIIEGWFEMVDKLTIER